MLIQLYSVLHMQRYKKYPTDLTVFKIFAVFKFHRFPGFPRLSNTLLFSQLQNLSETSSFQGHQPTIKNQHDIKSVKSVKSVGRYNYLRQINVICWR